MRVWQRLFLVLAALVLGTQLVTLWAQQQVFGHGLLDYVNGLDRSRVEAVVEQLSALYVREGSFESLAGTQGRFRRLVLRAEAGEGVAGGDAPADSPVRQREGRRPPRAERVRGAGQARPPPPKSGAIDLFARLKLQDRQGADIAGNLRLEKGEVIDIEAHGTVVGYLVLAALPQLNDAADLAFAEQQTRAMTLMAIGVVALALPLSLLLARQFTRPLRLVVNAAHALAAGNVAPPVEVRGRDEMADLAQDFNRLAELHTRNRSLRQQWMADVSHELRTPLTVLRGELEALTCGVRAPDASALRSLSAEAERLSALIDDLFQLSLADLGALEYRFETIDLRELLSDAVAAHQRALDEAGLAVSLSVGTELLPVRADPRRLRQLCDNLLVNARRYSDRGGRIEVQARREGRWARLRFDDTPPGVELQQFEQLFERFFRVERSRNRAGGGAGLGLAICKAIAEAHDARIEASASPLGGLRVELTLLLETAS
jgi:two-component system sensor histidine kinase BaeS